MKRRRSIIVNLGSALLTLPLFVSAFSKLTFHEDMVANMQVMGYGDFVRQIGFIELFTAVCYAIPLTRGIGFFLLNAYLGGAIAAELTSTGTQFLTPLFMLVLGWMLMFYDEPNWFLRGLLRTRASEDNP